MENLDLVDEGVQVTNFFLTLTALHTSFKADMKGKRGSNFRESRERYFINVQKDKNPMHELVLPAFLLCSSCCSCLTYYISVEEEKFSSVFFANLITCSLVNLRHVRLKGPVL